MTTLEILTVTLFAILTVVIVVGESIMIWRHRKANREPAEEIPDEVCGLSDDGWHCTRKKGHFGPCALVMRIGS